MPVAFSLGSWLSCFIFIATWIALVWIRSDLEPGHYQTIDGTYYQELRDDFLGGRPMVLDGLENKAGKEFSPYPPGFPLLLVVEKQLFSGGLGPFPNGFLIQVVLALLAIFLFFKNGLPPWIPALLLLGDGFLEVSCHTWSEGPFCLLSLVWVLCLANPRWSLWWILCFVGLFGLRYSAVFFLPASVILLLCFPKRQFPAWKAIATVLLVVLTWLAFETWRSGLPTGGDRYANGESSKQLLMGLVLGLLNQFSFFRDYTGSPFHPLFMEGLGVQVVFLLLVPRITRQAMTGPIQQKPSFPSLFWVVGSIYLVQILVVRWFFYFAEGFDNRLLIPGGFLIWAGILCWIWERGTRPGFWVFLSFWLAALFFGLPKTALFLRLQETIWGQTGPVFGP